MAVGYFQVYGKIWESCQIEWRDRGPTSTFLSDFFKEIYNYGFISAWDITLCLVLGVLFTILRYTLTLVLFKPLARWFEFTEKDQQKFPESAFKVLFYSSAFGYCSHILFNGDINFFEDTSLCWKGWYKGMPVSSNIYWLYMMEAGFYFHSVYATFFMDLWRRDSYLMLLHHVVTNSLILFSFATRYHRIGVLVLFLHDNCDIILELTKICVSFKSRGGKYHKIPDILCHVGFFSFASVWFFSRLYLYPLKVLYSTGCDARQYLPTAPFYFFFNTMLWILFFMNLWWFQFIIWLIIRVFTGQSREVEDTREIPKTTGKSSDNTHMETQAERAVGNGDVLDHGMNHDERYYSGSKSMNGSKRRVENAEAVTEKEGKEQSRRRQPRTKPANH